MDRRTALKYTSLMTGVTLSSAFVTGFLTGCKPATTGSDYLPQLLSEDQFHFLGQLSEVIIPTTDTPGALELGVSEILDNMATHCYTEEAQQAFIHQIQTLKEFLDQERNFSEANQEVQKSVVMDVESTLENEANSIAPAYKSLKGSIAATYLSTEYVGKNLLEYLPVPGEYQPCISISETNGKAWTYE